MATPTNVAELYQQILGRAPEQAGLDYWNQQFGTSLDPTEIGTFWSAAQPELQSTGFHPIYNPTAPSTVQTSTTTPTVGTTTTPGVASAASPAVATTSAATPATSGYVPQTFTLMDTAQLTPEQQQIANLYQTYLGRAPEQAGFDYWTQQFGSEVSPEEAATFQKAALPELQQQENVYQLYKSALGRDPTTQEMLDWGQKFGTTLDPYELNQFYGQINPEKIQNLSYSSPQNVTDLYQQVLGRAPSAEEAAGWQAQFGDTIDQNELNKFIQAAQPELTSSGYKSTTNPYIGYTGTEAYARGLHGDINSLFEYYAGRPATTQEQAYFGGKYGDYVDQNEIQDFQNTLYQGYQGLGAEQYKNIYGTDLTPEQISILNGTYNPGYGYGNEILSGKMSVDEAVKNILASGSNPSNVGYMNNTGYFSAQDLGFAPSIMGAIPTGWEMTPEQQSSLDKLNTDVRDYQAKYSALTDALSNAYYGLFQGGSESFEPYRNIDTIKELTAQLEALKQTAPDVTNYFSKDVLQPNYGMSMVYANNPEYGIDLLNQRIADPQTEQYYPGLGNLNSRDGIGTLISSYGTGYLPLDSSAYQGSYKDIYGMLASKYKKEMEDKASGGGLFGLGSLGNIIAGGLSLAFPAIAPFVSVANIGNALQSGNVLGAGLGAFGLSEASGLTNIGGSLGLSNTISNILPEGLDAATKAIVSNGIVQGGLNAAVTGIAGGDPLDALLASVATTGTRAVLNSTVPSVTSSILPADTSPTVMNAINVAIGSAASSAVNAAMQDQDAMTAFLAGGGQSLLASSIGNNLSTLVENPKLRAYLANNAASMIVNNAMQSFSGSSSSGSIKPTNSATIQQSTGSVPAKVDTSTLKPITTLPFKV